MDWREEAKNRTHIIGADECGYGSWAGNLFVCAAAVTPKWTPPLGLNDSKKVTKKDHERLYFIMKDVVPHEIEFATPSQIDRDGVIPCLKHCFLTVVTKLLKRFPGALVILDGEVNLRAFDIEHLNFPRADGEVPAVMAASVLGKYTHDRHMIELAQEYPGYGFSRNVGYHSPEHREAIKKKGMCPAHRRSYVPMEKLSGEELAMADDEGMVVDE